MNRPAPRHVPNGSEHVSGDPLARGESPLAELLVRELRLFFSAALRDAFEALKDELRNAVREEIRATRADEGRGAQLLSVVEVANQLNLRPATIREWIRLGFLRAVALGPAGRRYAIRPADLERALEVSSGAQKPMDMDDAAIQILKRSRSRSRASRKE